LLVFDPISGLWGLLTITKDEELLALTGSNLAEKGKQVEWDTEWVLTHDTAWVGTSWVEVSQQSAIPLVERLALLLEVVALSINVIGNDELDGGLGVSVWVSWANWAVLWDWNHVWNTGGVTVDGGGRREDDVGDIVLAHAAEESNGTSNIDAVVFERDFRRFTDCL
jgi:hypothetical protein